GSRSRSPARRAPVPRLPARVWNSATPSASARATSTGHRTGRWDAHVESSQLINSRAIIKPGRPPKTRSDALLVEPVATEPEQGLCDFESEFIDSAGRRLRESLAA